VTLRVAVVKPGELGAAEAAAWARFQRGSPTLLNPFLSLTFTQVVGRARASARVAVVEDGGSIVAFLPFELSANRIGLPIGWPMNDLQGFIGSEIRFDARSIVRKAGLRGWRFEHAPPEQAVLAPHYYRGTHVQCPVIDLSHGYDAYLKDAGLLTGRAAGKHRRKQRGLEREVGDLSLDWSSSDPALMRLMMTWRSGKYQASRKLFSKRSSVQILEELAATREEDCTGALSVLTAGGRPVALHFGIMGPQGLCWWFPAYDLDLGRFSPGIILVLAAAEEAAARQIPSIDLGYGQDAWKFSLATRSYPVAGGGVWATPFEATARALYRRLIYESPVREWRGTLRTRRHARAAR
jgi:CelD/BcsL family acetyltransferase involved in cellulose biosynthesis